MCQFLTVMAGRLLSFSIVMNNNGHTGLFEKSQEQATLEVTAVKRAFSGKRASTHNPTVISVSPITVFPATVSRAQEKLQ